jgi:murein DD-endopeptidase MepM/ murein hydrolase activator NlpD
MAQRHHTIILIPHAQAKLRKFRLATWHVWVGGVTFVVLNLVATFFLWSYFRTDINPVEIAHLRHENQRLREANLSFEGSLTRLQKQLSSYEDRTRQLAIVAGVESLQNGTDAGVGGGAPLDEHADSTSGSMPGLDTRTQALGEQLDTIETSLSERMRWISSTPAIAPVRGILTSGFGYRSDPLTHGAGSHEGIDIAAAPGQPVQTSADGIVVQAADVSGYGNSVLVSHGFGITTRYGHLSRIDVKPGQKVHRGDLIGRVGNTGRSTGYHLHYEVRIDGSPVNPLAYILDRSSGSL